ncbi:MAG: imidazole glycerol phosphate synthase subunit HisH [Chitinophagaceae bacterium]
MKIVIVQYNAGNIQSVLYALQRIGVSGIVSNNTEEITTADKVIFPGVGEASTAMQYLQEHQLDGVIKNLKQPTLGICLGMQLMCTHSEENNTPCLNIFDTQVKKFESNQLKIPQIGWNTIEPNNNVLFAGISPNSYCYFVHSYYASICSNTIATTNYTLPFSSALHKDNFYGVQFHPEKSAQVGQQIITNFLTLT